MDQIEQLKTTVVDMAKRCKLTESQTKAAMRGLAKKPQVVAYFYQWGVLKKGLFRVPYGALQHRYGGEVALATTLVLAQKALLQYQQRGISEQIFDQTMSDIKIWANNYRVTHGTDGIGELGWLLNHLDLRLFRLGRLQFQFFKVYNPLYLKPLSARAGQTEIFVHIPQGEKLTVEGAEDAFKQATAFFRTFYPAYDYRYFITETWLLYSKNSKFMRADSNILKFAALFRHGLDIADAAQATERIFGKQYSAQQTETSLQRAARQYAEAGGKFGVGLGSIKKEQYGG